MFCAALAGAGLGFLWFNAYPAEVFMGDVGALALGAALGIVAVIVRQEIVLFIMGGVFVVETLSVMLQVASFKLTGKTHLPHGAAAPSLRAERLEGESGCRALLDHHDDAGAVRTVDVEAALTGMIADGTGGRNALVLGLGRERPVDGALAAAIAARACAWPTRAQRRPAPRSSQRELPQVRWWRPARFGRDSFEGVDLIAISPGVPLTEPLVAQAAQRGVPVVGDIELFAQALPPSRAAKVLAITGSNGKSTVTEMTGAMCRKAGLRTVVAGNIGLPVLDALLEIEAAAEASAPDVFVLELSSFQLETTLLAGRRMPPRA